MCPKATVDTALQLSAIGILDKENALICGVSVAAIGTGATVAAVPQVAPLNVVPPVRDVTADRWTKRHTPTFWAFTSAMAALRADGGTYTPCGSPAPMIGPGSWRPTGEPCLK
jgi:hypothetical protein